MMPGNLTPKLNALELQLDLIRNADLYERRLKEIKAAAQEFKDEREKLTKAKDLVQALADAKQSADSAREALSDARSEAAHIVNQAEAKATDIVSSAQTRASEVAQATNGSLSEVVRQLGEKKGELDGLNAEAESVSQQIGLMTEQLDGLTDTVRSLEAQKAKLLELIADKQRKLKALMAE